MKNLELDYILGKIPSNIEPKFYQFPLLNNTIIDKNYINCEAISVFIDTILDKNTLSLFKNLEYIFLRSSGYSNVDLNYCAQRNIKVFNVPNYGTNSVSEYTFLLILNLYKKTRQTQENIKNGAINYNDLMGFELKNKTIGIIGLGSIGKKVASIANCFDMKVLAYDKFKNNNIYNYVEFEELISNSDIISINCPLTEETKNLFNKNVFSEMKPTSIIINTARGEIINSKDLYYALINKKIFAAGLDVIECEETFCEKFEFCNQYKELKENCYKKYFFTEKLSKLQNVIITPHNAYNTIEAIKNIIDVTLENINQTLNNPKNTGYKNLILI